MNLNDFSEITVNGIKVDAVNFVFGNGAVSTVWEAALPHGWLMTVNVQGLGANGVAEVEVRNGTLIPRPNLQQLPGPDNRPSNPAHLANRDNPVGTLDYNVVRRAGDSVTSVIGIGPRGETGQRVTLQADAMGNAMFYLRIGENAGPNDGTTGEPPLWTLGRNFFLQLMTPESATHRIILGHGPEDTEVPVLTGG